MSQNLHDMLETTLEKVKSLVDSNSVVGKPITTPDGTTILPISKISIGYGGGGSDRAVKTNAQSGGYGGGMGAGIQVTPVAFLITRGDSVRMIPVASAPSTTADRVVEMVPDVIDQITAFVDKRSKGKESE